MDKIYSFGYLFTLILGPLSSGICLSIFGAYSDLFMETRKIGKDSAHYAAIITTMIPIGAFVSSILFPFFCKWGKRIGLIISGILAILGASASAFLSDPVSTESSAIYMFYLGRFLLGMSVGLYISITPSYLVEIAPNGYESIFGSCYQLSITVGVAFSSIIGIYISNELASMKEKIHTVQFVSIIPCIAPGLQILFLIFNYTYDSPANYYREGNTKKAQEALNLIYSDDTIASKKLKELKPIGPVTPGDPSHNKSFYSAYKIAVWVGIGLPIIQQLTGINIVTMYSPMVFSSQGEFGKVLIVLLNITNTISSLLSVFAVNNFGRRTLMLFGCLGCGLTLFACSFFYPSGITKGQMSMKDLLFICSIFGYIMIYQLSHGPITWLYLAEVLPDNWVGIGSAMSSLFSIAISYTTPILFTVIGNLIFSLYGIFMFLSGFFLWVFMKESKGKRRQDLQNEYLVHSKTD